MKKILASTLALVIGLAALPVLTSSAETEKISVDPAAGTTAGNWEHSGDSYTYKGGAAGTNFGVWYLGTAKPSEKVTLSAEITIGVQNGFLIAISDSNGDGTIAENGEQYYLVQSSGTKIAIERNNGYWSGYCADAESGKAEGTRAQMTASYYNGQITVSIDGTEVLTYTDARPLPGMTFGISSKVVDGSITNVTVKTEEVGAPTYEAGTNLALHGAPFYTGYAHFDRGAAWILSNINDGNLINSNEAGKESCGYHSAYGQSMPGPQSVGYDFHTPTTFNTAVIYPCAPYTFPADFEIQVSNDGANWTTVHAETGYTVTSDHELYNPQTFTFDEVTARYMRLYITGFNMDGNGNYAVKLTEMEIFNKSQTPVYENLALNKPLDGSSDCHDDNDNNWHLSNINDGDIADVNTYQNEFGQFAGYHTHASKPSESQITINLGEGTEFNQMVIYPSHSAYKRANNMNPDLLDLYFPQNFRIQISNNGTDWETVLEKTGFTISTIDPVVLDFDTVTATYVRFDMFDLTDYVKLSEIEVYNIPAQKPVDPVDPTTPVDPVDPTKPEPVPTGSAVVALGAVAVLSLAGVAVATKKRR